MSAPDFPAQERKLFERLRTDFSYYAPVVLKIQTKLGETVPLFLNNAQKIVQAKRLEQLETKGYVRMLILKARQEGISTEVAGIVYQGCSTHRGRNALIVGDKDERSTVLWRIYDRFHREAPDAMRASTVKSLKRPFTLVTTMCLTENSMLEWVGSVCQVMEKPLLLLQVCN